MKFYIKVFIIAFVGFMLLFTGILFALDSIYNKSDMPEVSTQPTTESENPNDVDDVVDDDGKTELEKIAAASSRINIIAFGLNDHLADTMMLFSYDPELNVVDILSIPRDTYYHQEGFNDLAQKKLNATYGFPEVGGVNGMKKVLSEFLGIPIHYYLKVDFAAVKAVVDTLGGYEVTVPYDMDYDDNYADPSLNIHLKEGYQVLDGELTVGFLRFRKNNSGTINESDVQRIPRQQHFVNSMMNKAISSKLPSVINTVIGGKYVETDMSIEEALGFAIEGAAIKPENIKFYTVEGVAEMINGASYWIHDPAALEKTLYGFYGFTIGTPDEETTEGSTN